MKLIYLLPIILLAGCASGPLLEDWESLGEDDIINIDVEKYEQARVQDIKNNSSVKFTDEDVIVGDVDDVVVRAVKTIPFHVATIKTDVTQEAWDIIATNENDDDKCITIYWKLMDFKFVSFYPSEFLVPGDSTGTIGMMIQQVWEMEGVKFAPDASGYIQWMGVRDTVPDAVEGEECLYIETDIHEDGDGIIIDDSDVQDYDPEKDES